MAKGFREKSAQYRAVVKNRRTMRARGLARYEVRGLGSDKALLRDLAKRLSADDEQAKGLRSELKRALEPQTSEPGGIWRWLRSSPLVGSGINLEREQVTLRKIEL
jgi:hypothetical protein